MDYGIQTEVTNAPPSEEWMLVKVSAKHEVVVHEDGQSSLLGSESKMRLPVATALALIRQGVARAA